MISFIDDQREAHGGEMICKLLPIASSTYYSHKARQRDPARRSARSRRDAGLAEKISRIHTENYSVYGARKVWRQLRREGEDVARCTVERLTRGKGLQGGVRVKGAKTTICDRKAPCPQEKVNREFVADRPNRL